MDGLGRDRSGDGGSGWRLVRVRGGNSPLDAVKEKSDATDLLSDVQDRALELGAPFGPMPALSLARVLDFECSGRLEDSRAIYAVGVKRAARTGRTPVAELLRYSTLMRTRSARAQRIRTTQPPARLVQLAGELLRGEHSDPCPRSFGWGSKEDGPRAGTVPARCSGARLANMFYAVARRR